MSLFVGNEVQVNTFTTDSQHNSSTIALPDGGYVSVWQSFGQDSDGYGIFLQRFDADGNPVGVETKVSLSANHSQIKPQIVALDQGGFVVSYVSIQQDGSGHGIFQRQYDMNGDPVGNGETLVNSYVAGDQTKSKMTALSDGGWVVTWESNSQDGSGSGVFQQKFDASGNPVGGETQVNSYVTGIQDNIAVTALDDGKWVVTWVSNDGQDGSVKGVYQQLFDANGDPAGVENQVNTYTASNQEDQSVTALAGGGWVVSWSASAGTGDINGGIYQQAYDQDGVKVGGEVHVNSYTTDLQHNPEITALSDGGWVVTWVSTHDGDFFGIYQQRYGQDGNPLGGEIRVNTETVGGQAGQIVAALPNGGWVVVWVSSLQDGDGTGVYQQVYDANGAPVDGETRVNTFTAGDQKNPSITVLADGAFVVTWESTGQDGSNEGVFHKTFHFGNVAPESLDAVVSTNPGMAYTFSAASFGFSDADGDSLGAVIIDSADLGDGDLTYDGAAVTLPATIAIADLGKLVWTPPAMAGAGHGTLSYRVVDDGGTVYGGSDTDTTAATLTFNVAPNVKNALSNKFALEDAAFSFTIPGNAFEDLDGDTVSITKATLADGAALPDWLSFDGTTFSGMPENDDVGAINVKVTATDAYGAEGSGTFTISVANANDAPEIDKGLADKLTAVGLDFTYAIPVDAFLDIDGDMLTFEASQLSSPDLPAWMSFDGTTFTGSPMAADVGSYTIVVKAYDTSNAEITTTFTVTVNADNLAPTSTAIDTKTIDEKSPFTYTLPDGSFADPEEQALDFTLTYDGGMKPDWLDFDASTMTFSGMAGNDDVGDHVIELTASDGNSSSPPQSFTLTINNVNDAPVVAMAPKGATTAEDAVFEYQLPAGTFVDIDANDQLSYSFSSGTKVPLPTWLEFDSLTQTFSGTPDNGDVGTISVKVSATDLAGASTSVKFNIEVMNTNDAPTVDNEVESRVVKTGVTTKFTPPADIFGDVDAGDSLVWSATNTDDMALPNWLGFDMATHEFTAFPGIADIGQFDVKLTATDGSGASVFEIFTIMVTNNYTGPVAFKPIAPQTFQEDAPLEFTIPFETFIGLDGTSAILYNAQIVDGSPLPSWLHISSNGTFTSDPGFPGNNEVGTYHIRLFALEGLTISSMDFDITIENTNDAPYLKDAPAALANALEDTPYIFTLVDLLTGFDDVDANDGLSVSNVTADHGMVTDNMDGTYTFTPDQDYNGPVVLSYTVNDMNMGAIQATLDLTVDPVNDAPEGTDKTITILEDGSHIFTVDDFGFSDPLDNDGSQLQSIKISNIAGGGFLVLDAGGITGPVLVKAGDIITAAEIETLVWQPGPNNNGMNFGSFSFQVIDDGGTANGGVDTDQSANTITFDVTAVNDDAPFLSGQQATLANAVEDVNYTVAQADLLAGFDDPDMGDTLTIENVVADHGTVTLQPNGDWLLVAESDYNGIVNLTYDVKDSTGNIVAATQTFEVTPVNDAPVVATPIANKLAVKDVAFSFTPLDTFLDVDDAVDTLAWSATLDDANNSPLPGWLNFNEVTHEFSGTPAAGDVATLSIRLTVTDSAMASVSTVFTLEVAASNTAPVVDNPIVDQTVNEDVPFSLDVSGAFSDPDGNVLTLSATLADGSALPAWLKLASGKLSGTPEDGDVGTISVVVTATDGLDSASATFEITVNPVNDAPVGADKTITVDEDATYTLTLADFGYTDPNDADADAFFGVEILASAGQGTLTKLDGTAIALPVVLTVAEILGGLVWKPAADANGNGLGSFTFKVIDDGGTANGGINKDTVAKTITFDVTPVNDAPILSGVPGAIANGAEDQGILIMAPALLAGFTDPDAGDTLSVANLTINHGTLEDKSGGTWLFTPDQDYNGLVTLTYNVKDNEGALTAATLTFNLAPDNDAPIVFKDLADKLVVKDIVFSFTPPLDSFKDIDAGDEVLKWTATLDDDTQLPAWLDFNPATHEFSGTPPASAIGELLVKVTAADNGTPPKFISDTFKLTIAATNAAPVVANPITNQTVNEDGAFSLDVSAVFTDPDLNDLTISATLADDTQLPTWLHFDGVNFTGTPENGDTGTISVKVTATDGDKSVSETFDLTVNPVNDAPHGADSTITVTEGASHIFAIADFGYSDDENDDFAGIKITGFTGGELTLDGTALDPGAETLVTVGGFAKLVWTPSGNGAGSVTFQVIDKGDNANGGSNIDPTPNVIIFDVVPVNHAPTLENALIDQILAEDSNFTFTIPAGTFADIDMGDTMTLTATLEDGSDLPDWLHFDGTAFTGTPDNDAVGEINVKVTATDGSNASVSDSFMIKVNNVNDAPIVIKSLADKLVVKDSTTTITVADNSFMDVDVGDVLTWSATLADNSALPSWLKFDPGTHAFTVSPGQGEVGFYDVKVTVTDKAGLKISDEFKLTVAESNDAPVLVNPVADQTVNEDSPFSFMVPTDTFSDPDGNPLALEASLADGSDLPAWLHFDAVTNTFTGTPENGDVGVISIKLSATDGAETVSDTFDISIVNTNDAPTRANEIANQPGMPDVAFVFALPANIFADEDIGDTLTLTATLANGDPLTGTWLSFDGTTFTGTPGMGDIGTLSVTVTATDASGATVTDTFDIVTDLINDAPSSADGVIAAKEDKVFSFAADDFAFFDPNADSFKSVIIDAFAGKGTLLLDGKAVEAGTEIAVADLGDLTFKSAKNGFGDDYAQLSFRVVDDGGTAGGGNDTDPMTHILTINVADTTDTFNGTRGKDTLNGTDGHDVFKGKAGNDKLNGMEGSDTFIFKTNWDKDLIKDFDAVGSDHDVLNLHGLKSVKSWSDLRHHHMEQHGNNVVIDGGHGDVITLKGVDIHDLGKADFIF